MNTEDSYFGHDMSDREYRARIEREQAREQYYANARMNETKQKSSDSSAYRFSSDGDDQYLMY